MFARRSSFVVTGFATGFELAHDPAVISSAHTEAKLSSILRENPDLVAINVIPANAEPLSAFRAESLSGSDVEAISAEAMLSTSKAKVVVGEPRKIEASGQFVMPFSSVVNIDGSKVATIVAIASLQP